MNDDPWSGGAGLARTVVDGRSRVVLWRPGTVSARVARVAGESFSDLPDLLAAAGGDHCAIDEGEVVSLTEAALLSPVGRPRKILCVGQNYLAHVAESGRRDGPAYPDLFAKWDNALSGPCAPIPLPTESSQIDFEAELAVVIGRRARKIPAEEAASVIFGYTAANDGSVRDFQFHTGQRTAGKAWDRLTPLGPVVVPAVKLGGAHPDLRITGLLNGRVMQDDRTGNMLFGIGELLAYITTFLTLDPGDVILTGTPSGVGAARTPPVWLRDGDEFEVRIEGVGSLRNRYTC